MAIVAVMVINHTILLHGSIHGIPKAAMISSSLGGWIASHKSYNAWVIFSSSILGDFLLPSIPTYLMPESHILYPYSNPFARMLTLKAADPVKYKIANPYYDFGYAFKSIRLWIFEVGCLQIPIYIIEPALAHLS